MPKIVVAQLQNAKMLAAYKSLVCHMYFPIFGLVGRWYTANFVRPDWLSRSQKNCRMTHDATPSVCIKLVGSPVGHHAAFVGLAAAGIIHIQAPYRFTLLSHSQLLPHSLHPVTMPPCSDPSDSTSRRHARLHADVDLLPPTPASPSAPHTAFCSCIPWSRLHLHHRRSAAPPSSVSTTPPYPPILLEIFVICVLVTVRCVDFVSC
jgi:hypothetical protein